MRKHLAGGAIFLIALAGATFFCDGSSARAADAEGAMLVHDVYFTLKDNSADARTKFIDSCKKYLTKHPGTLHFAVGPRAEEIKGRVNDQEFDVALHIVFKDKAALEKYRVSDRHQQFIKEVQDSLKKVRVFDSLVEK
jgi:hypothetical protein